MTEYNVFMINEVIRHSNPRTEPDILILVTFGSDNYYDSENRNIGQAEIN